MVVRRSRFVVRFLSWVSGRIRLPLVHQIAIVRKARTTHRPATKDRCYTTTPVLRDRRWWKILKLSKFPSRRHPLPIVRTSGWLHVRWAGQHLLFAVNQIAGIEVASSNPWPWVMASVGRPPHNNAEYASIIVDVIDLRVALGAGNALLAVFSAASI